MRVTLPYFMRRRGAIGERELAKLEKKRRRENKEIRGQTIDRNALTNAHFSFEKELF
jgi:hypothetical protein